ncbi:MAG: Holliday junction branch migration protein RuvA [Acidobacteria bacterium]|jgi:Holliday junction DNA helicase RuvA|nr:Holliday junction branch migration protein RuvA [Acidobacteriota bacterium]
MISAIKGRVFEISPGKVQVETGSGIILHLLVPISSYTTIKNQEDVLLHTVLRIKEESMILYGFLTAKEKTFFEKFTAISGIGGKTALSLISAFSLNELVEAINNGDASKISSIPGIGKKTAQRIILELTGKLELEEEQVPETLMLRDDLVSGLVNLGYPAKSVSDLVNKTLKEYPDMTSFEELFKILLKKISKL